MTSKEADRLIKAQKSAAETRARDIARRWEIEPEAVAYEMALGKIEHLKGFLSGTEAVFNAYFVTEDPIHERHHESFKRELSQLSRELEYGSIVMPDEATDAFEVIRTPLAVLSCQYTTYEDGRICGVFYRGIRIEDNETAPQATLYPSSPVLGETVMIQPIAS